MVLARYQFDKRINLSTFIIDTLHLTHTIRACMIRKEHIQHLIYRLKIRLGMLRIEPPDQIEELKKDPQRPPEYMERFSLVAIDAPEQVGGREKDLESLQRAYNNWQQVHRPILLVGEPGCGMTSFIHAAWPILDNPQIIADEHRLRRREQLLAELGRVLEVADADSIEALAEKVSAETPRVVIFENIERIFLRKLGGFSLLEDLRTIVNLTSDRVFWILTINSYPLYYLDRISGIRSFFSNTFRYRLQAFDPAYIEETIAARNEGYHPIFLNSDHMPPALERALGKADPEQKQLLLSEHFFQHLHAFAAGNMSRALLYWVASIQGVRGEKIYLRPFAPKPIQTAQAYGNTPQGGIDQQGLFALEAILQHGSLAAEDLDQVLRSSEQSSRLTIARLRKDEWIFARGIRKGRKEYQVNLLYLHELKKLLINKFNRQVEIV